MRTILVTRDMVKVCTLAWLAVGMLTLVSLPAYSAGYEEGKHYHTLPQAQPVQTGDNIEVLELFWYHCPHCFALAPFLEQWSENAKPENAEYIRMPGIFRKSTIFDARVFYTLEALGLTDKTHADIFQEIHVRKNPFQSLDDLRDFLKKHGINEVDFKDAFESFAVDTKLKQAQLMFERYQATGVPTIVVDGKYRATASSAGGHQELMELTNFLVEKAASERP
ncbi:MAG: thiol:disulfide interchange protein DsbA/DsbL [Arenicellales bacterium]|nr:thiol:disulfide interchange protein DsbA/DsbL [Arenicellales bacterium]